MIKRMIYLDETTNSALYKIAHAKHKSVSQVIREAIASYFTKKDVYDLATYDERMAEYLGKPSSAVAFRDIMDK